MDTKARHDRLDGRGPALAGGSLSRRLFLGAAAAGAAPLFLGVRGLMAQSPREGGADDPMLTHFVGAMVENHKAVVRDGLHAEHVRKHAAIVRAVAVYGANNRGWDDKVRESMRVNLRRHGRDGLIARVHHNQEQCEDCKQKLEAGGLDLSTIPPVLREASPELKGKAIDRLAAVGISPVFHREADILERRARATERTFGANVVLARNTAPPDRPSLRRVQDDDCDDMFISMFDPPDRPAMRLAYCEDGDGSVGGGGGNNCRSWQFLIIEKDTITAIVCFDPLTAEICLPAIANDAALRLMAWFAGC
jgi:hypothetical protein